MGCTDKNSDYKTDDRSSYLSNNKGGSLSSGKWWFSMLTLEKKFLTLPNV